MESHPQHSEFRNNPKNTIFTLIVIKLVLISVPTMYLSYSYNLIATHKILRTPYLGAPLLGG